jgi:hypothetical protein
VASVTVRRDDLYEVLGVTPAASSDEIAAAFRSHAKLLHPDRNPGDGHAAERFKELTLAYQTLIRPGSREAYDERHHRPTRPTTPPATTAPASSTHDPIFQTPGRARAAVGSGIACFALGITAAVLLIFVNTGGAAETVTLWIAAVKLLVCGPLLAAFGTYRLHRLATGQ